MQGAINWWYCDKMLTYDVRDVSEWSRLVLEKVKEAFSKIKNEVVFYEKN